MSQRRLKEEPPPPPLDPQQARDRHIFIRDLVKEVDTYKKQGKTFDEMKELVPLLANNYPHLFVMITSDEGYDKQTLDIMIGMLEKMGKAKIDQNDASIAIGSHLMKKFIKPADK